MNWFKRIFGIEEKAIGTPSTSGAISDMLAGISRNGRPPVRGCAQILATYSTNPRLRSIVDRIAQAIGAVPWHAYRVTDNSIARKSFGINTKSAGVRSQVKMCPGTRDQVIKRLAETGGVEKLDWHPVIGLMSNPHKQLTGAQVRQISQIHLELTGEAFYLIERSKKGIPGELWPLPPVWVTKLPQAGDDNFTITALDGVPKRIASADIVWIKYPDPLNPYGRGTGIGLTLNNELDVDEYAAQTASYMFNNNAIPDFVVSLKGADQDSIAAFRQNWLNDHLGYKKRSLPKFTNADLNIQKLSSSFADLEMVEMRKFERDIIRETYGTPPEIVGDNENSNRATITQAQKLFATNVLIPRLDMLEDALNAFLVPQFGDNGDVIVLYDSPTPTDVDMESDIKRALPWAFSVNEIRKTAGEAPLTDGDGTLHMIPFGLVAQHIDVGTGNDARDPAPDQHAKEEPIDAPVIDAPTKLLKKKSKIDKRVQAVVDSIDPNDLYAETSKLWHEKVLDWMSDQVRSLGASVQTNVLTALTSTHLKEFAGDRIPMINQTTRDQLAETLSEGIENGDVMVDMIGRTRAVFATASDARAELIARTEANRSGNFAITAGQRIAGVDRKEWISNRDSHTRDSHKALDGQIVGIDEKFRVNGHSTDYPGNFGVASEDCNCRCVSAPVIEDGSKSTVRLNPDMAWKAFDRKLTQWDKQGVMAFRRGFIRQRASAIAAVKKHLA